MNYFQLVVLVIGGASAIIGSVAIITGAIVKAKAKDIKDPCVKEFDHIKSNIHGIEKNASERHDRIIKMEIKFEEIINRIEKLERVIEENIKLTTQIYMDMPKRLGNGRSSKPRN